LAASSGDAEAQFYMGWFYLNGRGVPKDIKTGRKWMQRSIWQSYQPAKDYSDEHGLGF
jgi:TPR repeat protein